jgi:hypothetical protein
MIETRTTLMTQSSNVHHYFDKIKTYSCLIPKCNHSKKLIKIHQVHPIVLTFRLQMDQDALNVLKIRDVQL